MWRIEEELAQQVQGLGRGIRQHLLEGHRCLLLEGDLVVVRQLCDFLSSAEEEAIRAGPTSPLLMQAPFHILTQITVPHHPHTPSLPRLLRCYPDKTWPFCSQGKLGPRYTCMNRSHFLLGKKATPRLPQQWLLLTGQTRGLGVPRMRNTQQSCSMSFSPGNRGDPFNSSPIMQPTALWIQM